MRLARVAAAAVVAALAACQGPDVGQACTLHRVPGPLTADWFETGNTACVNLTCIESPMPAGETKVKHNPYCSKPCVSNRDCFNSETGLVCRAVVLDPEFVAYLDTLAPSQCGATGTTTCRQKYLGDIQFSNYCAIRLP
jgi:hypothetical protein